MALWFWPAGDADKALDSLKVPPRWKVDPKAVGAQVVNVDKNDEYKQIEDYFLQTLGSSFKVQKIERIQNVQMWQS